MMSPKCNKYENKTIDGSGWPMTRLTDQNLYTQVKDLFRRGGTQLQKQLNTCVCKSVKLSLATSYYILALYHLGKNAVLQFPPFQKGCGGKGPSHSKKKSVKLHKLLPESQKFLDILGKNLEIFYKFSRFVSEKKFFLPKNLSVKKKFLNFHNF